MSLSENNYPGDWLKKEFDPDYCRETLTVKSGQKLKSGAVVAKDSSASNKIVEYEGDGSNGTDAAVGVLVNAVDASATGTNADTPGVILVRGPAIVSKAGLTWKTGESTSDDIPEGLADLLALGIVAREGV